MYAKLSVRKECQWTRVRKVLRSTAYCRFVGELLYSSSRPCSFFFRNNHEMLTKVFSRARLWVWLSWSSQILLGHVLDLRTQLCTPRRRDGFRSSVWSVHSFCVSCGRFWPYVLPATAGMSCCLYYSVSVGRHSVFRLCLFMVGVWIYDYFRGKACFIVHSLSRYFFTCVTGRPGGLIDWRIFLNLSKMMYRLAFSGSRHFVCLLSFSFVDIVARRLGVSWEQNPKPNGFFVNPKCEARVSLWSRLWNDGYLCEPD